ncbi:penton [Mayetiola barley midge adintovirus]|uniref:penton n=1 Tax=Mayetiola barley midge adintovirus TaxID=2609858 RepID=UPI002481A704|nr:penton [Mayetiola barley midge adintovirus]DAC81327.1 TPA_asm: penton [Mayetiola barley midge adintovirus]
MSSTTITLSGSSSTLSTYFHPEIELDDRFNYSCSLLDFHTYNVVPNVHENNNKFYYADAANNSVFYSIIIPVGTYEVSEICEHITRQLIEKNFVMRGNKNTLKCEIETDLTIDFTVEDSIGSLLGFSKKILENSLSYESDKLVNINSINCIRIECDLTTGSFHNGKGTHTIYEFTPKVAAGYKISEQPRNLIYLPVVKRRINTVNIDIVDQDGELIDFRARPVNKMLVYNDNSSLYNNKNCSKDYIKQSTVKSTISRSRKPKGTTSTKRTINQKNIKFLKSLGLTVVKNKRNVRQHSSN